MQIAAWRTAGRIGAGISFRAGLYSKLGLLPSGKPPYMWQVLECAGLSRRAVGPRRPKYFSESLRPGSYSEHDYHYRFSREARKKHLTPP